MSKMADLNKISSKLLLQQPRYRSGKSDPAKVAHLAHRNRESRNIEFSAYLSAAVAKRQAH